MEAPNPYEPSSFQSTPPKRYSKVQNYLLGLELFAVLTGLIGIQVFLAIIFNRNELPDALRPGSLGLQFFGVAILVSLFSYPLFLLNLLTGQRRLLVIRILSLFLLFFLLAVMGSMF